MSYVQRLERNIKLYYLSDYLYNSFFTVVIWVSFQRQYMNFAEIAALGSLSVLVILVLQMPTGAFADLVGRRTSNVIGSVLRVIGYLVIAFSVDKTWIIVSSIIMCAGDAFVSGSAGSLLYDSLLELGREKEYAHIKATSVFYDQIAIVLAMLIGGYLYEVWNGLPYLMVSLAYILMTVAYFLQVEPRREHQHITVNSYFLKMKLGFMEMFKNAKMIELTMFYVVVGAISYVMQVNFNQIYASALGFSELQKAWIFSVFRAFVAFVLIKWLRVDKKFNEHNSFTLFSIILAFVCLPAFIENQVLGLLITFATTGIASIRFIVADRLVNHEIDRAHRATAMSALSMLFSLAYIIMVAVFGPMFDTTYAGNIFTIIGLLLILLVIPLAIILKRKNAV